jgi:hypothetical protein
MPARFLSAEELRMVRAIALLALLEAARHGEYRASFHGFRVQALRQCTAFGADVFVEVNLCVSFGRLLSSAAWWQWTCRGESMRGFRRSQRVPTNDAGAMEPMRRATVI